MNSVTELRQGPGSWFDVQMKNAELLSKLGMLTVFAALVGCGTDGPGTGPISPAAAMAGCEAGCEYDKMCDPTSTETVAACTADCVADVGAGGIRADAFEAITDCATALACTADDDICFNECSPTSAHESYETACRAKLAECGGMAADVDGACETTPGVDKGFLCVFTPAVMAELEDCFALDCAGLDACFNTVTAKYGFGG